MRFLVLVLISASPFCLPSFSRAAASPPSQEHLLVLGGCEALLAPVSGAEAAMLEEVLDGRIPLSSPQALFTALRKGLLSKKIAPSEFATAALVHGARAQLENYDVQLLSQELIVGDDGRLTAKGEQLLSGALNRLALRYRFDHAPYHALFREAFFDVAKNRFLEHLKAKSRLGRSVWTFSFSREEFAKELELRKSGGHAHPLMMLRDEIPQMPVWDESWKPQKYDVTTLAETAGPRLLLHVFSFEGLQAYLHAIYGDDAMQLKPAEGLVAKQDLDRSLQKKEIGLIPPDTNPPSFAHGQENGPFAFSMHDVLHAASGSQLARETRFALSRIARLLPHRGYSPYRSEFADFQFPGLHNVFNPYLDYFHRGPRRTIERRMALELSEIFYIGKEAVRAALLKDLADSPELYREQRIDPLRFAEEIRGK